MHTRTPPLRIKIMLVSNPLKSRILVRRLAIVLTIASASPFGPPPELSLRIPPRAQNKPPAYLSTFVLLLPVSITRFLLRIFSPGAGLLRNPFFTLSTLRFSRGCVRKDGNLLTETGCIHGRRLAP